MWSTVACRTACSPVVSTTAFASVSSSRRGVEKRRVGAGKTPVYAAGLKSVVPRAAVSTGAVTTEEETEEDVIPRVEGEFVWDEDRQFSRHRDLEYFNQDLTGVHYGGDDSGTKVSRIERLASQKCQLPSPVTYKVTTPSSYDPQRLKPYPVVVIVPADAGYGTPGGDRVSGTQAVCYRGGGRKFHEKNDCLVCELGFNRPTWVADTSSTNHESFVLDVVLPRLCLEYNVGKMSLLGYGNGGFGALHLLMRHPAIFHRCAVADVPVLGDYEGELKPWGLELFDETGTATFPHDGRNPYSETFLATFPHDDMFTPYSAGLLATCEDVKREMNDLFVKDGGVCRIGLWSGAHTSWEMNQLAEQFYEFDIHHKWSSAFENEPGSWEGGWVDEALRFLADDL